MDDPPVQVQPKSDDLAPLPLRALAFALLTAVALASIWYIDRRAMLTQARHGWSLNRGPGSGAQGSEF